MVANPHVKLATKGGEISDLFRPPKLRIATLRPRDVTLGVVSIPVPTEQIRVIGFTFPESAVCPHLLMPPVPPTENGKPTETVSDCENPAESSQKLPLKYTRLQPPADLVKLEDRLYYLLQPPLESLLQTGALKFPFEPFKYQFEGIAFLYPRAHAVLADEMGLGKTMQAVTAIRLLLHAGQIRRILLICPKPLVSNWQREFQLWAPEIPLTVIAGNQQRRTWLWQHPEAVVTIANYELLIRDEELVTDKSQTYDLVLLDESQRIKNSSSSTSQVVRKIHRRRSWALTGTPIENSPDDLVGIFEFVSPGYLRQGMKPRSMAKAVRDHVLRRTKDRVLTDLPPKMFRDAEVELTSEQRASYLKAEEEGVVRLAGMGEDLTIQHVFELVLRLKQICNFDPVTGASAKMERLQADIEECADSGRKAIVFSQWVKSLQQIKQHLRKFHPVEYHGQLPTKQRETAIEEFKQSKQSSVILMSYGAGSVGLNLQFCGYVFLFDRWWNPAVEDQAINRAHRIGAAGPVTVTRFLTQGTIEQRINQILELKRELFDTIFASGDAPAPRNFGMTHDEIFGLFKLQSPKGPIHSAA
jgi:SNF2 family DNA or RNA helicase